MIEALSDIRIEHVAWLVVDYAEEFFDGIMATACLFESRRSLARSEPPILAPMPA